MYVYLHEFQMIFQTNLIDNKLFLHKAREILQNDIAAPDDYFHKISDSNENIAF